MNRTGIEWTHWSANPLKLELPDGSRVNACIKASAGCKHCYAEAMTRRWWKKKWGAFPGYSAALYKIGKPVLVMEELDAVLKLSSRIYAGKADPKENMIFWSDMTDEYLGRWPQEMLNTIWKTRWGTPNLIHQVLTKHPGNLVKFLNGNSDATRFSNDLAMMSGVWLGTSTEDQETFNRRTPVLRNLALRGWKTFLSVEPMIGSIVPPQDVGWLGGAIIGGESGGGSRPFDAANAQWLIKRLTAVGVPVFVKQLGDNVVDPRATSADHFEPNECWPRGTKAKQQLIQLKMPKGGAMKEWPKVFRQRDMFFRK